MQHKIVHLEPITTEWGDVRISAVIATQNRKTTVEWDVTYPPSMPEPSRIEFEALVQKFMKNQHDDLVRLFGQ